MSDEVTQRLDGTAVYQVTEEDKKRTMEENLLPGKAMDEALRALNLPEYQRLSVALQLAGMTLQGLNLGGRYDKDMNAHMGESFARQLMEIGPDGIVAALALINVALPKAVRLLAEGKLTLAKDGPPINHHQQGTC